MGEQVRGDARSPEHWNKQRSVASFLSTTTQRQDLFRQITLSYRMEENEKISFSGMILSSSLFFFSKEMHLIENLKSCFLVPGRQQLKTPELTLTCKTVVRILKIKFVQKAVISLQTGPRKKEPEWRGEQCYQNFSRLTYRLVSEIHKDGLSKDAQKEATVQENFKRQKSQEAIKV